MRLLGGQLEVSQLRSLESNAGYYKEGDRCAKDHAGYGTHHAGGYAAFEGADLVAGGDKHRVGSRYAAAHVVWGVELKDGAAHYNADGIEAPYQHQAGSTQPVSSNHDI